MTASTGTLARRSFRAMNIDIELMLPASQSAERKLSRAERWVHAFERRFSRFIPTSELSRLNASPSDAVSVSPMLYELLETCLEFAERSNGLFDPAVLADLEAAGYDRTFAAVGLAGAVSAASEDGYSYRDVSLGHSDRTVRRPQGLKLDIAGIGKGWAVDRLARYLGSDCLVNAGGDIFAAGTPLEGPAWLVGVENPFRPEEDLLLLALNDRGIATSSTLKRRWRTAAGADAHHLIDPRRRRPSDTDLAAVTVVAATATLADFHAKVALLLGSIAGRRYMEDEAGVDGVVVCLDGAVALTDGLRTLVVESARV